MLRAASAQLRTDIHNVPAAMLTRGKLPDIELALIQFKR
jgi:hypothetical protein